MYTCIHTWICVYIYIYMHTSTMTHKNIHTHLFAHIHTPRTLAHTHTHTHTHIYIYIYISYKWLCNLNRLLLAMETIPIMSLLKHLALLLPLLASDLHWTTDSIVVLCEQLHEGVGEKVEEPLLPALFVFGDSLVDGGNNNFIPSLAKSNFYPYCIDFPLGPTGRFCNGRTVMDLVGMS